MTHRTIKINLELFNLLKKETIDNFTVKEIRDELLKNSSRTQCPKQLRRLVYNQLIKLVNFKALNKTGAKSSHNVCYKKTERFKYVSFLKQTKLVKENRVEEQLESTIQKYKAEMMSSMGESEEYTQLCKIFPHMKNEIEQKALKTKDEIAKIRGKIKALNNILETITESDYGALQ